MISHVLHRGELVWLPSTRGKTRKGVEKRIRECQQRVAELLAHKSATEVHTVTEGEWTAYLTVSARLERGAAMRHCLGDIVGGLGQPYIAVGKGNDTYGFRLGPLYAQEVRGKCNETVLEPDWEGARAMAEKYSHLASWHETETESMHEALMDAQEDLELARQLELAIAVEQGRYVAPVTLDILHDEDRQWLYYPPSTRDPAAFREWWVQVRESRAQVEYTTVSKPSGYGIRKVAACAILDHYDPELAEASNFPLDTWS